MQLLINKFNLENVTVMLLSDSSGEANVSTNRIIIMANRSAAGILPCEGHCKPETMTTSSKTHDSIVFWLLDGFIKMSGLHFFVL